MKRSRNYWVSAGLIGLSVGVALGLVISWRVLPRMPNYARWPELRQDYQDDFIVMLGWAFSQDGDLTRAQERLALLHDPNVAAHVERLAETAIAEGHAPSERRGLAHLAHALGASSGPIMAYVATPMPTATATPESTPLPTPTVSPTRTIRTQAQASPTRTQTPTPRRSPMSSPPPLATQPPPAYIVAESERLQGDANSAPGELIILVIGPQGESLPGIRVRVSWDGGSEICITGLHPERDPGYADMSMMAGVTYSAYVVGDSSEKAEGLFIEPPQADGENASPPDSWRVLFRQSYK